MPSHIETLNLNDNQVPQGGLVALKPQIYLRALQGPLSNLMDGRAYVIQIGNVKPRQVKLGGQVIEGAHDYQLQVNYWLADAENAIGGEVVHGAILRVDPGLGDEEAPRATHKGRVFYPHPEGWQLAE